MAIYDTYSKLIAPSIIKQILADGEAPTAGEFARRFTEFADAHDLSKPLFSAEDYTVDWKEASSVAKWNTANTAVRQDLDVLYKHLLVISDQSMQNFSRWRLEASLLEKQLDVLSERLATLLLVSRDTAGYFNFMQDNIVDLSKIDTEETTAYVNLNQGIATLGTSNIGATKVNTSSLVNEDVRFAVLSKNLWVSNSSPRDSQLIYAVNDENNYWQVSTRMSAIGPVTIELKVDLKAETEISRIDVDLHQSNTSSSVEVMPLLSTDNHGYTQLPTTSYKKSAIDKVTFVFPPTNTRYIKFVMTKRGYDYVDKKQYVYEFGMDQIAFYNEGFQEDTEAIFMSLPLSVNDVYGAAQPFSRLVLEVCEDIPTGTTVDYYVAATDSDDTATTNMAFVGINPLDRDDGIAPKVLDFGDIAVVSVSGLAVSYDATASSGTFQFPSQQYNLITGVNGLEAVVGSGDASKIRYVANQGTDVILTHTLDSGVNIAEGSLELWRNTSRQGEVHREVRDIRAGWGYEEPYYKTTVYVENKAGNDVDFGGNPVMIDGVSTTGKVTLEFGRHTVWVHEDNWKEIEFGAADLNALKAIDQLYPYNHRYLIEGYPYGEGWPDEKTYLGFDIVAEFFMRETSVFDMLYNVPNTSYEFFARDVEAADPAAYLDGASTAKGETIAFLTKADVNNGDLINEDFMLKFKAVNSQVKHVRLKAVLKTTDAEVAPFLDSYRIKVSS